MGRQNFNCSITVNITAQQALDNISRIDDWWSKDLKGKAEKEGDTFTVRFGTTFVDFKIEEAEENKIVWLATDSCLPWLTEKDEWTGTKVVWQLSAEQDGTKINFTHIGLVPEIECYNDCKKGWTFYVQESLLKLITTGTGLPEMRKAMA